ncbi:28S ribosomal protein S5, mitochondrial [Eumeta japonica]|uniref:Small ribosomal subunit protein uS5m n=1 Tax=Eumeta variegata TaxID=151549 RepID=A0A4C1T1G6_EUMVA|nr:28S ribosomal protein S5, mitochondrial [Eumeta japonica]
MLGKNMEEEGSGKRMGYIKVKKWSWQKCFVPELNSPIIQGNELIKQQLLPENTERDKIFLNSCDSVSDFRVMKLSPIDRGWSGSKMPGRSIGPPDAIDEDNFENFDTRVLEHKIVFIMKGNMGRKRRFSVMSVTGNEKGLAGFATAKSSEPRAALKKSKNRAGKASQN